jgi:hypothetical protein
MLQTITTNNTGSLNANTTGSITTSTGNITTNSIWVNPNLISTYDYSYDILTSSESFDIKILNRPKLESLLSTCYKQIENNCIEFNVYLDGVEIKPIDKILMMIEKNISFDFDIVRTGYKLIVKNAKFKTIKNLIETSANDHILVEFEYEKMIFKNTLKSKEILRSEKIDLLKHKLNKNDI